MQRLIVFLLTFILCSCTSTTSIFQRGTASLDKQPEVEFKGIREYFRSDEDVYTFELTNLANKPIKYKVEIPKDLIPSGDKNKSTCKINTESLQELNAVKCFVTVKVPLETISYDITVTVGDIQETTQFLNFQILSDDFCISYIHLIDLFYSNRTNEDGLSDIEYYRQSSPSSFKNDCAVITSEYSDNFDNVEVYKHCTQRLSQNNSAKIEELKTLNIAEYCSEE